MSADNYWLITKHPNGGFAVIMGFVSDDNPPTVNPERHQQFTTGLEAVEYINQQAADGNWTEYGTRMDEAAFLDRLDNG